MPWSPPPPPPPVRLGPALPDPAPGGGGGGGGQPDVLYGCPLMHKRPGKLIIHASTNDALISSADEILFELIQLKSYIKNRFEIDATFSCPTMRNDNIRAKKVVAELCGKLQSLNIPVICNSNVTNGSMGKGGKHPGLHLKPKGSSILASNFISYNRKH